MRGHLCTAIHSDKLLSRPMLQPLKDVHFLGCIRLELVIFSETSVLHEIQNNAFMSCESMTKLPLPDSVKQIGMGAVGGCTSLTTFRIPHPMTAIDMNIFWPQNHLLTIEIPDTVGRVTYDGRHIDNPRVGSFEVLRNVAFSPRCQVARNVTCKFISLGTLFSNDEEMTHMLSQRFVGLPIHGMCYYHTYCDVRCLNIPNLSAQKGVADKRLTKDKLQDEHSCLSVLFKSLCDINKNGGFDLFICGKEVRVKVWIHYFIGDTEGNNKWLGQYPGNKEGIQRPYRDCTCSFDQLQLSNPRCQYIRLEDIRECRRRKRDDDDNGISYLKSVSRYDISNALLHPHLPLSDNIHGQFKTWLGIPLEPHPSLGAPESEFPLPIPEFRKIPSENRRKKNYGFLLKNRNRNFRFRNSGILCT